MFIEHINGKNIINSNQDILNNIDNKKNNNNLFDKFLNSAIELYNETSKYELEAEKLQLDYASGKIDDILEVTLAEQKASIAVNFAAQVSNKVIESYRQIMNIQL